MDRRLTGWSPAWSKRSCLSTPLKLEVLPGQSPLADFRLRWPNVNTGREFPKNSGVRLPEIIGELSPN
jgi:hypothetical protein